MLLSAELLSNVSVMKTIRSSVRYSWSLKRPSLLWLSATGLLLLLVSGCSSEDAKSKLKSQTRPDNPEATPSSLPLNSTPTKLKLVVDAPESLRVKQGDLIVKGQVLVDRSAARQQILARRQKVQQEVALLTATENIPIAPTDSSAVAAQVQQARERVRFADAAIKDYLAKSPYTDVARQTLPLPQEEKQLAQLQLAKSTAEAQLEQAIAQLNSLQSTQQARQRVQADASFKQKRLLNELKTIETQLQALQDIQSPHDAIVQKVDWQKQDKKGTTVELALAVHSVAAPISPLPNSSSDPLLSVPGSTPALPTDGQSFPNIPTNPANPLLPSTSSAPQTTVPGQPIPPTLQNP